MDRFVLDANKTLCMVQMTNNLPLLRARLNLSQEEFAEYVGMSRQTISAIENKKKKMSWTTCMAFIAFFASNDKTRKLLNTGSCVLDILNEVAAV